MRRALSLLCLSFLSLFSVVVHAECREVVMWDGGAGPRATPESACTSIWPDHAQSFHGLHACDGSSCICRWLSKTGYLITWGTVRKVITYEGDDCPVEPDHCAGLEGQTRYAELRFPAGVTDPTPSGPVEINGCEAVLSGEDGKVVSLCLVDADDPSMVVCGARYKFTGRLASGDMPDFNKEPASTGVTDSRVTEEQETVSPPSTVVNPDGSTTTVTVEEKTVSNPPSAVITETDKLVEFIQTSATSYDKITTVTTTTTNPDGTQVVVTEVTREKHTVPSYYTSIDKTTGSVSQTVTPGRTETGTTTTTEYVDSDGNVTNRTVIHHGGGGQGAGGVGAPGQSGDQGPQSTCGGPGQPPCQVEFDDSGLSVPSMPSQEGSWWESSYPDGLAGIWAKHQASLNQTPLMVWLNSWSFADSGACPSWSFSFNLGAAGNFGTHAIEVPCWLWDVIRAIVMLSALLLARRLVFGG